MNPEYTFTVSKYQTACGTVDILMHTFERYFTHTPDVDLTDELAEGLCRAVIRAGTKAVKNGSDYEARATLMWAGSISHNDLTGLGRRGDWATHQMEHELSGQYDRVSHGAGLAAIFPAWCRYVWREEPARFVRFAQKIWGVNTEGMTQEEAVFAGIECCENYFRALGMPVRLSEMEIDDTHLHDMAVKGTYFGKRTLGSFKVLGEADIEAIYSYCIEIRRNTMARFSVNFYSYSLDHGVDIEVTIPSFSSATGIRPENGHMRFLRSFPCSICFMAMETTGTAGCAIQAWSAWRRNSALRL